MQKNILVKTRKLKNFFLSYKLEQENFWFNVSSIALYHRAMCFRTMNNRIVLPPCCMERDMKKLIFHLVLGWQSYKAVIVLISPEQQLAMGAGHWNGGLDQDQRQLSRNS